MQRVRDKGKGRVRNVNSGGQRGRGQEIWDLRDNGWRTGSRKGRHETEDKGARNRVQGIGNNAQVARYRGTRDRRGMAQRAKEGTEAGSC